MALHNFSDEEWTNSKFKTKSVNFQKQTINNHNNKQINKQ